MAYDPSSLVTFTNFIANYKTNTRNVFLNAKTNLITWVGVVSDHTVDDKFPYN